MFRLTIIATLVFATLTTAGCGGGRVPLGPNDKPINDPPSPTVTVTPATASVYQGATFQFQAQVSGTTNQNVSWSVQDNFGTIDNTGLYTAPHDSSGGGIRITATSQADPNASGTAIVGVLSVVVNVSPASVTLGPGGTQSFTSSIVGLTDSSVSWSIREAAGGSISAGGIYTAPQTPGFYHVIASSDADHTRVGGATISITTFSAKFTPTDSMQSARGFHTATLLSNGEVLMAGGASRQDPLCDGGIVSAELYDSVSRSFSSTGKMNSRRYSHTATLLADGDVLMLGGFGSGEDCEDLGEPPVSMAEVFNTVTASFSSAGNLLTKRGAHTATLLPDGKVLVAGGGDQGGATLPFYGNALSSAEIFDPISKSSIVAGDMAVARYGHTATLLPNGKVLIVGGTASYSSTPTTICELYDPATGLFTLAGNALTPHAGHTATLLPDGKVLIAGGFNSGIVNGQIAVTSSAELYDPATGSFSATGRMGVAREEFNATLLLNGTVLVTGGGDSTAELYDPSTGYFSPAATMEASRIGHSATLLPDGTVLVAGGGSWSPLSSAELYK